MYRKLFFLAFVILVRALTMNCTAEESSGDTNTAAPAVTEIIDKTKSTQSMEITFEAVFQYKGRVNTDAEMTVEYDGKMYPMAAKADRYETLVYATGLRDNQPYMLHAAHRGRTYSKIARVNIDFTELVINYEPGIDTVSRIAIADLEKSKTITCGSLSIQPQPAGGHYNGIWTTDSGEAYEAIRYWADNSYVKNYLYSTARSRQGLIDYFGDLQEKSGKYKGNLTEAVYEDQKYHFDGNKTIDYGGGFDMASRPRVNHRDLGNSVYVFCNYWYWKDFNDITYIIKYYDVMKEFFKYHLTRKDPATGLIKSTYIIDHTDVCINNAVPESCAIFSNNSLLCIGLKQFGEMAGAIGKNKDAEYYAIEAQKLRAAINTHMWNQDNKRYEIKIFKNVTTDKSSPAYGITEDHHFFPAAHARFLDSWGINGWRIPDTEERIETIINSIEEAQKGIKVYAPLVVPPYPNGWHHQIFDDGAYANGNCWVQLGGCGGIAALFDLGYPKKALGHLADLTEVAERDGSFHEYYEDNADGRGRGVDHYNWANSKYIYCLVNGLFGLLADYPNNVLYIHPSLTHSGRIRARLGKHGVDMALDIDEPSGKNKLTISTTYSGPADIRLWIKDGAAGCEVTKNETDKITCKIEKIGRATYAVFKDNLAAGVNTYNLLCKDTAD